MDAFNSSVQTYTVKALQPYASNESWLEYSEHIVKVIIEDGVTSISDGAFANCEKLESISIPESVMEIASLAFTGSEKLAQINYAGTEEDWAQVSKDVELAPETEIVFYDTIGDVNGNGYIDNIDATVILMYDAGIIDLDSAQKAVADVNGDGNFDNLDATMILKYDAGIIDEL